MRNPTAMMHNTPGEELASVLTHALGTVLASLAAAGLVVAAALGGDPWRVVTLSVFGATLVAVYLISTVYHLVRRPVAKRRLRRLDHAAIFLLIAGTYTPLVVVTLGGIWGWSLLGAVWAMAAVGLTLKLVCFDRFGWTQLGLMLAMGWMIVVAIKPMMAAMSPAGLAWLVAGGLSYTLGVVFFLWRRLRYHHAIWHLFVLAGSVCHVMAMVTDVLPRR